MNSVCTVICLHTPNHTVHLPECVICLNGHTYISHVLLQVCIAVCFLSLYVASTIIQIPFCIVCRHAMSVQNSTTACAVSDRVPYGDQIPTSCLQSQARGETNRPTHPIEIQDAIFKKKELGKERGCKTTTPCLIFLTYRHSVSLAQSMPLGNGDTELKGMQ